VKGSTNPLILTTNYGYDNADRMISNTLNASSGGNGNSYSFGYDLNGSLTTETNNVSGGEVTSYIFDVRNRLTQVQKNKGSTVLSTASFAYDGKNTRLSQTYGGKTTSYLQDATGLPVVLQETVNAQTSSFMYPLGSTSPLFQSDVNNLPLWYHADGLGSIRALTDGSGAIKNTNSYSAFGGNEGATGKAANTHLFAGEQLDPTGLYFNRARYYNSNTGRFIGRDDYSGILYVPASTHRYLYTQNNPLLWIDPSGYKKTMTPAELQVTVDACKEAFLRGLEPMCDIPSTALVYFVEGVKMVLTPEQAGSQNAMGGTTDLGDGVNIRDLGSRRNVYLRAFSDIAKKFVPRIPDIVTANDQPNFWCLILPNEAPGTGGIYEVEPANNPNVAMQQLLDFILIIAINGYTKNSKSTYEGINWRLGTGLSGFATSVFLVYANKFSLITAEYSGPGLILFTEYDRVRYPLTSPSPTSGLPQWTPMPGPIKR
jgi:RHS repeat-associated protein